MGRLHITMGQLWSGAVIRILTQQQRKVKAQQAREAEREKIESRTTATKVQET